MWQTHRGGRQCPNTRWRKTKKTEALHCQHNRSLSYQTGVSLKGLSQRFISTHFRKINRGTREGPKELWDTTCVLSTQQQEEEEEEGEPLCHRQRLERHQKPGPSTYVAQTSPTTPAIWLSAHLGSLRDPQHLGCSVFLHYTAVDIWGWTMTPKAAHRQTDRRTERPHAHGRCGPPARNHSVAAVRYRRTRRPSGLGGGTLDQYHPLTKPWP